MTLTKPFRYSDYFGRRKKRDLNAPRPEANKTDEGLTGLVRGEKASDLEERLARAFYKLKIPFDFQVEIRTRTSMPNEDRKVDFVIRGNQAVEPDGQISHFMNVGQKGRDYLRDLQLNEAFAQMGMLPIIHIPFHKLDTQERTDAYVRRHL